MGEFELKFSHPDTLRHLFQLFVPEFLIHSQQMECLDYLKNNKTFIHAVPKGNRA